MPSGNYNRNIRALVIDHETFSRDMAVGILRKMGIPTDSIDNTMEIELACQRVHYDLILMDIDMPERDGFETTKLIRRKKLLPGSSRIIALSSRGMDMHQIQLCIVSGMNDCILKPLQERILHGRLLRWFPKKDYG